MKFEDDDLKDGKLWAALQKEIDRDLAEKESGEKIGRASCRERV